MNRSTPLSHSRLPRAVVVSLVALFAAILITLPSIAHAAVIQGAILKSTPVYSSASTSGSQLTTLPEGSTIQAAEVGDKWLTANFTIGGAKKQGYVQRSALGKFTGDGKVLRGASIFGDMRVYRSPSKSGTSIHTFREGSTLQFTEFNSDFHFARLSSGEIAYIPRDQIVRYRATSSAALTVYALSGGAKAYKAPYPASPSYQSFAVGTKLTVVEFANDWYMASVNVSGASTVAFFRKAELSASQQTGGSTNPGGGGGSEVVDDDAAITYSDYDLTLTKAAQMQLSQRSPVGYYGGKASYSEVYKYMDPSLAKQGTTWFLQFLRLDKSAGVTVAQLNARLNGKGILNGQGAAFIEAGRRYGINELYLVAHAELETGNGSSRLAKGAWYNPNYSHPGDPDRHWVEEKPADTTGWVRVYNMYGIGAYDGNVYNGGYKYAYDQKWNTPESAIIGGAKFIGQTYIARGQNTLYKMRWNPDYMSTNQTTHWRQYATDVGWAVKQTAFISSMYKNIDVYAMHFDVPRYSGK